MTVTFYQRKKRIKIRLCVGSLRLHRYKSAFKNAVCIYKGNCLFRSAANRKNNIRKGENVRPVNKKKRGKKMRCIRFNDDKFFITKRTGFLHRIPKTETGKNNGAAVFVTGNCGRNS